MGKITAVYLSVYDSYLLKNNEYSRTGKDLEFNRGYSSFNHKLGDKANIINPNLGPIIKPPFYSLKIEAATLGTEVQ